jgi:hypothetical protein
VDKPNSGRTWVRGKRRGRQNLAGFETRLYLRRLTASVGMWSYKMPSALPMPMKDSQLCSFPLSSIVSCLCTMNTTGWLPVVEKLQCQVKGGNQLSMLAVIFGPA